MNTVRNEIATHIPYNMYLLLIILVIAYVKRHELIKSIKQQAILIYIPLIYIPD